MKSRIIYLANGKNRYLIDDVEVTRAEFDKHFPSKIEDLLKAGTTLPSHSTTCWPMRSEALAVHPKQIAEATERNRRHGSSVTYDKDGTAILPDRGERKRIMRIEGLHDRQGGYGD